MDRKQLYFKYEKLQKAVIKYLGEIQKRDQKILKLQQKIDQLIERNKERDEWERTQNF